MTTPERRFTEKEEAFCQAYARTHIGAASARAAGYSGNKGSDILKKEHIKERITEIEKVALENVNKGRAAQGKPEITVEWVMDNLVEVVERCMTQVEVLDLNGDGTGQFTFDSKGANRALELIGKQQGMFVERKVIAKTGHDETEKSLNQKLDELAKKLSKNGNGHKPLVSQSSS